MVIVLMGVAGSGKTTVGLALAAALGWGFCDADDLHPPANIAKMSSGLALNDSDRAPWLTAVRAHIHVKVTSGENAVVACSALKESYRGALIAEPSQVKLVHLVGDPTLLAQRIAGRSDHFMKPQMLASQLTILEPPRDALAVDIAAPPPVIVARIRRSFAL